MDDHHKALQVLCRICGQRCLKFAVKRNPIDKHKYHNNILKVYQVDVSNDNPAIHPAHICLSCTASFTKKAARQLVHWGPHEDDCPTCDRLHSAGRHPKPQTVAAKRRKEREEREKEEKEMVEKAEEERRAVEDACNVLLSANNQAMQPCKKLKLVASAIVKTVMVDDRVELPTGGPKLVLPKISMPKVQSQSASPSTIKRTSEIRRVIDAVSSPIPGDEEAATFQLAALLKGKSSAELHKIIEERGLLKIRIPDGDELAFKAKHGMSWSLLRDLKIFLKAYHVSIQHEGGSRKLKAAILNESNYKVEKLPFFFKDGKDTITKLAPMYWLTNLTDYLMHSLDELDRTNQLSWKHVPTGKIWLKIGADKGGDSVKVHFQIVNTENPNSPQNSVVFCMFKADESLANLHIALDGFVQEINNLQQLKWRDMPIELWLCGDLEIQRKLLGLQGTSANCPCTQCHITRDLLDTFETGEPHEPRTLQTILEDYNEVVKGGSTPLSKRENHSVSGRPFFSIPTDHVCPPWLHITIGLWEKFFKTLELELNHLGQLIGHDLARNSFAGMSEVKFRSYVETTKQMLEKVDDLEEEADKCREQATNLQAAIISEGLTSLENVAPSASQLKQITDLNDKAKCLDNQAQDLKKSNTLDDRSNPLIEKLDEALISFKVRRQAFRSQSFVGNHVKKCLKPENYTALLDSVPSTTNKLTENENLSDLAESIKVKYLQLFEKLALSVNSINEATSATDWDQCEAHIADLASHYKTKIRATFTPKFHHLLHHVVPFIRRTRVPIGIMNEQGGEHLHAIFNTLERRLAGAKNSRKEDPEIALVRACIEEHLIQVYPKNRKHCTREE